MFIILHVRVVDMFACTMCLLQGLGEPGYNEEFTWNLSQQLIQVCMHDACFYNDALAEMDFCQNNDSG